MNISKFRFTLDLQKTQSQVSVPVTLGDTARTWYISFSDGARPFPIGQGCLAKLEIKRPTGTFLEEFCPIEDGMTVRYAFSQNANTAAVEGLHECAIILYDEEENVIGSPRFAMVVTDRLISSDDLNLSDENRSAIESMLTAEASRQAAEEGRVNAEAARAAAEIARENGFVTLKKEMEDASNGFSPTAELSKAQGVATLTVTDRNGPKTVEIHDGKSAYAYAKEGGYGGTEAQFGEKLSELLTLTSAEEVGF